MPSQANPTKRDVSPKADREGFKELQIAILALGHTIELDKHNTSSDINCYRVSASAARIHVVADPDPYGAGDPDPDGHQRGDVWSVEVW
ncbi:hypothetical protein [Streptomyces sp. NPDC059168]|uniref:hypothetical protein n=1 Tax=Streptomyces sp. NPDC059168 TaxID=3346753 RepID=UPI0036BFCAEC